MFRRTNRSFFPSASRNARRASKAILRANRSDQKFMQRYHERQERFARYKRAFTFNPLNLRSFRAVWFAFTTIVAGLFQPVQPRLVHANRDGMLGSRKKRRRSRKNSRSGKAVSEITYEAMEPKQLLASDISFANSALVITDNAGADDLFSVSTNTAGEITVLSTQGFNADQVPDGFTLEGPSLRFPPSLVDSFTINGGAGDDNFTAGGGVGNGVGADGVDLIFNSTGGGNRFSINAATLAGLNPDANGVSRLESGDSLSLVENGGVGGVIEGAFFGEQGSSIAAIRNPFQTLNPNASVLGDANAADGFVHFGDIDIAENII